MSRWSKSEGSPPINSDFNMDSSEEGSGPDLTVDQDLTLRAQWSAASQSITMRGFIVEVQ
jgi:hypothetical protein